MIPKLGLPHPKLGWASPKLVWMSPNLGLMSPKLGWMKPELGLTKPKLGMLHPKSGWMKPKLGMLLPKLGNFGHPAVCRGSRQARRQPLPLGCLGHTFQGLERRNGTFSRDWKVSHAAFPSPGKRGGKFSRPWKNSAALFPALENGCRNLLPTAPAAAILRAVMLHKGVRHE